MPLGTRVSFAFQGPCSRSNSNSRIDEDQTLLLYTRVEVYGGVSAHPSERMVIQSMDGKRIPALRLASGSSTEQS